MTIHDLPTPALLIDYEKMDANLRAMQSLCDRTSTSLWPHIKTHKMVPVLRRQLELGAVGAACAKVGEAESMLPSGVRRLFIAHSLVQPALAPRLRALHEQLDELILAVTSEKQCEALDELLRIAGLSVPVLMAVDTGLHREGVRNPQGAEALARRIRKSSRMTFRGLYTHEGFAYGATPEELDALVDRAHAFLSVCSDRAGGDPSLWPGCSVTASRMAGRRGVEAVRPGSYVFGDLSLTESLRVMSPDHVALTVLTTVVDLPEPGMALTDAGSKVLSSDRSAAGIYGRSIEYPTVAADRLSEEHGFLHGEGVAELKLGTCLRLVPAHVCPVVNLASRVHVVKGDEIVDTWVVDARGRSD